MGCTRSQHKDKTVVISLNTEQTSVSHPPALWLGVLLQQVHFMLGWDGDHASPTTGRNHWCFGFYTKKRVSLQPKILFKKTVGTTAMLPTAGLKGRNLKKSDLLSATFWKLY